MHSHIDQTINIISKKLKKRFGKRIESLLLFGSSRYQNRSGKPDDIDLELLLDIPNKNDLLHLSQIISMINQQAELHTSYKSQLKELKGFRRKAQGSYLLYSLADGILLAGRENYFKLLLGKIQPNTVKKDLMIKNQEYQYSLREFLIEKDLLKFIKYLLRYISQLMIVNDELTYPELLRLSREDFIQKIFQSSIFSKQEIRILNRKNINKNELIKKGTEILFRTDTLLQKQYHQIYG